jgi:hypothetical protein
MSKKEEDRLPPLRERLPVYAAMVSTLAAASVFIDWSFQVSKYSFLSRLGFAEHAAVLANSFMLLVFGGTAAAALVLMVSGVLTGIRGVRQSAHEGIVLVLFFWAVLLAFAHADTFAYSVSGRNIVDIPRWANVLLLVMLLAATWRLHAKYGERAYAKFVPLRKPASYLFIAAAAVFAFLLYQKHADYQSYFAGHDEFSSAAAAKNLPNIIMFSSDGLEAKHMGAYGYRRDTTPNISAVAARSSVYLMAFSNAGNSRASATSLLTGKSPLTSGVMYPPDMLIGADAYQHLPGLLAKLGYYCMELTDGEQISSLRTNMRLGFHSVNGVETAMASLGPWVSRIVSLYDQEAYFLGAVFERMVTRLAYLAGISDQLRYSRVMLDYLRGAGGFPESEVETRLFRAMVKEIQASEKPVFAYIHLLRTHGPYFDQIFRTHSAGRAQEEPWDPDFYDDSILTVDYLFGELVDALAESGKLENTMIIVLTDHGMNNVNDHPLPLIVHMPGQERRLLLRAPVQYLDIAPSVLAYLGHEKPDWLEGTEVFPTLHPQKLKERSIFSYKPAGAAVDVTEEGQWHVNRYAGPPYYGVQLASVLKEGFLYEHHLQDGRGRLLDVVSRAPESMEIDNPKMAQTYRAMLFRHLEEKGVDISAIRVD